MEVTISSWSALSSSMMQTSSSMKSQGHSVSVSGTVREQEVSTDAYLPEFFIGKDLTPRTSELLILGLKHREKLLSLDNLKNADGSFNVSDAQVAFIQNLRDQRRLDASLPPVTDAFSLNLRTRQMEAAEFAAWKRRDQEMKELNEKRLVLIRDVLRQYLDEHVYHRVNKKVAMVRGHKESEVTRFLVASERTRNKILRKLRAGQLRTLNAVNNMGAVGKEKELNNLRILEKLDCFATVQTAEQPIKFQPQFEVEVQDLKTVAGLNDINLPQRRSTLNAPSGPVSNSLRPSDKEMLSSALRLIKTEINWRARAKAEAVMQEAQSKLTGEAAMTGLAGLNAENFANTTSGEGKEETPRIERPKSSSADDAAETQRLVRGLLRRAEIQKSLETRMLLVEELRAVEKETDFVYSDDSLKEVEAQIGGLVSQALDDLNKELIRLEEEQRLSVAVFAIVRERRMKEAEEAGRRQHEELRRDREDEIFRQIMQVNRGTVHSYIEHIIGQTVAQMVSEIPNDTQCSAEAAAAVPSLDESTEEAKIADVVVDVVQNFLFPHIDRLELHRNLLARRTAVGRASVATLTSLVDRVISASPSHA